MNGGRVEEPGLYQRWGRLRDRDAFDGYAHRTMVNLVIDQARRPWRREQSTDHLLEVPAPDAMADWEDWDEATRALGRLMSRQRTCLVLRFYLDCSSKETAQILGCGTGNVSRLTSDALRAVERTLEEDRT